MAHRPSSAVKVQYVDRTAKSILQESISFWGEALHFGETTSALPPACFDLRSVLRRTPSLPDKIPRVKSIKGYSTWRNYDASCSLTTRIERPKELWLRRLHRTKCVPSSSNNFRIWGENPNQGVALLVLGWAYILSANMSERQGMCMEYRDPSRPLPKPEPTCRSPSVTVVNLPYATPEEVAWWRAVAAPGVGWSIEGGQIAPWAVQVDDGFALEFSLSTAATYADANQSQTPPPPPTSRDAAVYLARFCQAYGLGGEQLSAALAAALTIALHSAGCWAGGATIELPPPSLTFPEGPQGTGASALNEPPEDFALLGRYIALSLNESIFGPALWHVFWNPHVTCNYAGAWLSPAVAVLGPILERDEMELLARVMSFASPRMAPLWLGFAICGRRGRIQTVLPSITKMHNYPWACPDVDSAAWTGTAQSFMDVHPSGTRLRDGRISRADVWRLRHALHRTYAAGVGTGFWQTPFYAWPPFGKMRAEDVELEIRSHLACHHVWRYAFWTWLPSGERDVGCLPPGLRPGAVIKLLEIGGSASEDEDEDEVEGEDEDEVKGEDEGEVGDENGDEDECSRSEDFGDGDKEEDNGIEDDEDSGIEDAALPERGRKIGKCKILREASRAATAAIFTWSCCQVEEGFGGTVVQPRNVYGNEPVKESGVRTQTFDPALVYNWLRALDVHEQDQDNRDPPRLKCSRDDVGAS